MPKFQKGDVCEIVYVRNSNRPGHERYWKPGYLVTVVSRECGLSPYFFVPYEYVVEHEYGIAYVLGDQLRKRPDDKPFTSWFREHIITDPIAEETIKRTLANMADYTGGRG
jgi:hypothetical protein